MRDLMHKIRGRFRHGLAAQEVLDLLGRRGIVFFPYIVFQENVATQFGRGRHADSFHARQLTENDIAGLMTMVDRPRDEAEMQERFRRGHVGFGAFERETIVAYTWCDLDKITSPGQDAALRPLDSDEAYLYDAYTIPRCRGLELVPLLRSEVYEIMREKGRRRLFSVSLFFNRSARRFKAKLGAREVELRLSVSLLGKCKRDLLLRRYGNGRCEPSGGAEAR